MAVLRVAQKAGSKAGHWGTHLADCLVVLKAVKMVERLAARKVA
jgi:hypothetical protein